MSIGLALGFSIAAPPGPINATVAQKVDRSWLDGFLVGMGATTADAIFLTLTYIGWINIVAKGSVTSLLYLAGGSIMLFYSILSIRSFGSNPSFNRHTKNRIPYLIGLSIGLTNPFQIAWWLTVGFTSISAFGLVVIIGFFSGITLWNIIYTTALRVGIARMRSFRIGVRYFSAATLFFFGLWFLYNSIF